MKTFSNYKKIALIFVIIAIFACTVRSGLYFK